MTTLTMPSSPGFTRQSWGMFSNTQIFQSPLTRSVQTLSLTGSRWNANFKLPPMKIDLASTWFAFLSELEGRNGRFYANPPNKTPRGNAGGTPLVNGASQTGKSLITNGWTSGVNNILMKGDFIELANGELKMITANVNSDGGGNATLSITPSLRNSPDNASAITTTNPKVTMMLSSDQVDWDRDRLRIYGISFSAVEVWAS